MQKVENIDNIQQQTKRALTELITVMPMTEEQTIVVGCSTSEINGQPIGTAGSLAIAQAVWQVLAEFRQRYKFQLAIQCCEHLNRSLVVEAESTLVAQRCDRFRRVHAIPVINAGGALATTAWEKMDRPILLEAIQAAAGIDIGETMIGMHLQAVAVPLRYEQPYIGKARVLLATTRPPLIGGARATYNEEEL